MPIRNKQQSFGLWLSEPFLLHPERLKAAVHDLAQSGYGVIRVILRRTNFNHRSPAVVDAVRTLVESAHAKSVKLVLDCEPHGEPFVADMGEMFPAATGTRLVRGEVSIFNGRF